MRSDDQRRLIFFAVGVCLLLTAGWLYLQQQVFPHLASGLHSNDFKHMWLGARLLSLHQSPYDESLLFALANQHNLGGINPYVYLPFTGLVMTPIAQFPFPQAVVIWFWLSHASLVLAIALAGIHAVGKRWWMAPLPVALGLAIAAGMMPLMRQLTAGQLNCVLALALVAILITVERRWYWLAGAAVAFAMLFKLSPGLFLLLFIWKRAWRLLAWTALWTALFMLWSLWQVGWDIHMQFLPLLSDMRVGHSTWAQHGMTFHIDPANQAMGSFLSHILAGESGTIPWINLGIGMANALTTLFAIAVLAGIIFLTRKGWGTEGSDSETWRAEWGLVVVGSLLIPSLCWDHYTVQLLPVLVVGIWGMLNSPHIGKASHVVAALLWLAAAWLLTVYVSHWSEDLRNGLGLLAMSVRLWGMLLTFGLLAWWRLAIRIPPTKAPGNP